MAIIDDSARMATATALEETVCIVVPNHLIEAKLDGADPFVKALVRLLCANVRQVTDKLGDCLAKSDC